MKEDSYLVHRGHAVAYGWDVDPDYKPEHGYRVSYSKHPVGIEWVHGCTTFAQACEAIDDLIEGQEVSR